MGNNNAATAWETITAHNPHDKIKVVTHKEFSLRPKRFKPSKVNRAERPVCNITAAMMKTPTTKNTAWLPNKDNASCVGRAPNVGRSDSPTKLVTGRGTAPNNHQPWPWGRGLGYFCVVWFLKTALLKLAGAAWRGRTALPAAHEPFESLQLPKPRQELWRTRERSKQGEA